MGASGIHSLRSELNVSALFSSSAISGMLYTTRLSCLLSLSRASAFRSNSRSLSLCSLSESSASASHFSKLVQSEDLVGEARTSLKLLAGFGVFVGDVTGDVLLEGCD